MRSLILSLALVLSGLVLAPTSQASDWDKKTIMTFSAPVEVPGAVLTPGKYVIQRTDPGGNPDIVTFKSADERHVYATVVAIPTVSTIVPEKPTITFAETRTGAPDAIKRWYYPGEQTGEEFVYSKNSDVLMASNQGMNHEAMREDSGRVGYRTEMTPLPEPAPASEEVKGQEQKTTEMAQNRMPEQNNAPAASSTTTNQNTQEQSTSSSSSTTSTTNETGMNQTANRNLPQTGSELPLLFALGAGTLGAGLGLKGLFVKKR